MYAFAVASFVFVIECRALGKQHVAYHGCNALVHLCLCQFLGGNTEIFACRTFNQLFELRFCNIVCHKNKKPSLYSILAIFIKGSEE